MVFIKLAARKACAIMFVFALVYAMFNLGSNVPCGILMVSMAALYLMIGNPRKSSGKKR
jgi:hypothetical protein